MDKDNVFLQIEKSGNLPTLPEILLKLLAACDDEESSIGDIADIISKDPVLSLRVLQLVNSAYYGLSHSFSNVEQAVVYLGVKTIKSIAVTTSVHQVFEQKTASSSNQIQTGTFWYHSLKCATLAKRISEETGLGNGDEAYLAALLHDIGKLLLASTFPEIYSLDESSSIIGPEELYQETERMGTNHCETGAWLVRQWNLGSLVVDAIQYHHEALEQVAEAFPLVKIVYMANVLAKCDMDGSYADQAGEMLFGLDREGFAECVGSAADEVDQIASSMGIKVSQPRASGQGNTDRDKEHDIEIDELDQEAALSDRMAANNAVQTTIAARVRNTSLLSTFQEDLMQAEETEDILSTFEKAMAILLGIDKVLFFLPDSAEMLLRGRASEANSLYHISKGLTFAVKQGASLIVRAFHDNSSALLTRNQHGASIADQQLLTVLKCSEALPIPLVVNKRPMGVIVLGLSEMSGAPGQEDMQLLKIVAQQVGLRLYIEQEKERQAEIVNKERMAAISMTSRKLAHEINNPLGIIGNYLVTLKMKLSGEDNVPEELDIIDEEIQRISTLVGQMEMYSQASFTHFQEVDINSVLRDIIQICKPSLFADAGLSVSFIPSADIPLLITSKDAIKQIIINLLKNAAEAMVTGGRVMVRTKNHKQDNVAGQSGIEIIVTDSGPGLPEHVKENLYQPFVTTKQNGHSGLGLSIVQKAVTDIGGKLFCSSRQSEGTTFTIYLPTGRPDSRIVTEKDHEF